jgi:hypothetical protein
MDSGFAKEKNKKLRTLLFHKYRIARDFNG